MAQLQQSQQSQDDVAALDRKVFFYLFHISFLRVFIQLHKSFYELRYYLWNYWRYAAVNVLVLRLLLRY